MSLLRPFTPETLVSVRRISGYALARDGGSAVLAVDELADDGKAYRTNLLRIDLGARSDGTWLTRDDRKKGAPRALQGGDVGFLCQPDPAAVRPAHLPKPADDAKDAKDANPKDAPRQVFRLAAHGGAPVQLTDLPRGADDVQWTQDGSQLVALSSCLAGTTSLEHARELEKAWKDRKPSGILHEAFPLRYWDHWLGPRHPHLVTAGGGGLAPRDLTPGLGFGLFECSVELSPEGTQACVDFTVLDDEQRMVQQLHLVDLATGERRALTSGDREHSAPRWSPDGTRIAAVSWKTEARKTAKSDIVLVDVASGAATNVTPHLDILPERPVWIDARSLAFTHDEGGNHVVRVLDVETGESRVLVDHGNATDLQLSHDREWAFYVHDRVDAPPELWRVRVAGGEPERLTWLNADAIAGVALAPAASFTVTGADGASVQLFEVRPPGFDASRRYPMLLWIHGGPVHAYADQFHFRWNAQVYAAQGYVVVMVNPRGSTGFGQEFIQGNNGNWGDLCYRDLMAVADEWMTKPYIDADRVAACGASFGGYMVNWIAGHETRFRCLVSHAGLFHLPAFHGTTDAGPWWELEFGGKPWESPELYERWSPHRFAGSFKTPTLVIHGELDYRVPLGEGLQMFLALQRQKVPSKFLYFPDENHWILKPANLLLWNETVLAWLKEWMG